MLRWALLSLLLTPWVVSAADAPAAQPPAAATSNANAILQSHALKEGEILRLVKPPFTDARHQWFGAQGADASERGCGLVYVLPDGTMFSPGGPFEHWPVSPEMLGARWYEIEGIEHVRLPAITADLVVRVRAPVQQKATALCALLKAETGQTLNVSSGLKRRPTIVVSGETASEGFACPSFDGDPQRMMFAIFVTDKPLEDEKLQQWADRLQRLGVAGRPDGFALFNWAGATHHLGAVFADDATRHGVWQGGGRIADLVLLDKDISRWTPSDAGYAEKLARVVQNLEKQLGGTWHVEDRDVPIVRITPSAEETP